MKDSILLAASGAILCLALLSLARCTPAQMARAQAAKAATCALIEGLPDSPEVEAAREVCGRADEQTVSQVLVAVSKCNVDQSP